MARQTNYLIIHKGMDFPPGSVVPASVFPAGVEAHLHIGSISPTFNPVTVDLPGVLIERPKIDGVDEVEVKAAFRELEDRLREVSGKHAEVVIAKDQATAEIEALKAELEAAKKESSEWKELAEHAEKNAKMINPEGSTVTP